MVETGVRVPPRAPELIDWQVAPSAGPYRAHCSEHGMTLGANTLDDLYALIGQTMDDPRIHIAGPWQMRVEGV